MPSFAAVSRITASLPEQDRRRDPLVDDVAGRADDGVVLALREHDALRLSSLRALRMTKCMTLRDGPSIRSSCSR